VLLEEEGLLLAGVVNVDSMRKINDFKNDA